MRHKMAAALSSAQQEDYNHTDISQLLREISTSKAANSAVDDNLVDSDSSSAASETTQQVDVAAPDRWSKVSCP